MKYPYLAAQLFNAPLMVRPETAEVFASTFMQILAGQINVGERSAAAEEKLRPEAFASNYAGERFATKRYVVTNAGIGILPIYGAMVQRAGEISPDCTEMTSYQRLGRTFDAMVADPDVRAILLEVDSPGGQVAGNFEFGRRIMEARGRKPVWAHANEIAFSGGYSLGASAERLYVPDTGLVGSIGVIMLHMSQAERDAKAGYKYTAIFAGAHKNDHNPHFALSDEARVRIQAMVDSNYQIFVDHVAAARGIEAAAVRKTEAGILEARAALELKLVDGITTFAETLAALESRLNGVVQQPRAGLAAHQPEKETQMSEKNPAATDSSKPATEVTTTTAAPTPPTAPDAAKVAAEVRAAERTRITSILALEEAKGRTKLATHLATETELSVEQAKATLAASPLEAVAKGSGFAAVMGGIKNPAVGAGGEVDDEDPDVVARRIAGVAPDKQPNPTH